MISIKLIIAFLFLFIGVFSDEYHDDNYAETSTRETDWMKKGQDSIKEALKAKKLTNIAKNYIIFVGDGMGLSTTAVSRIYLAQDTNKPLSEVELAWEKMPYSGLSKTYSSDHQTSDSAATATALYTGVKTNQALIGLNEKAKRRNCSTQKGNELKNIFDFARNDHKKWTGVVTTTRLTHATPAAAYAYSVHRNWESDAEQIKQNVTEEDRKECKDIAQYLIEDRNNDMRVWLGGGRKYFTPNTTRDQEYPNDGNATGTRLDGKDLIKQWVEKHKGKYVWNLDEFDKVNPSTTNHLLGLFEPDHMKYEYDRSEDENKPKTEREPSLKEMVEKAIKILRRNSNGYILLVEGGRIDHAHHNSHAAFAIKETLALHEAVAKAEELTKEDETLIIVTADHSHTFSLGGYATMDNPVLGVNDGYLGDDNKNYTNVGYANGPGYMYSENRGGDLTQQRIDPTNEIVTDMDYRQDSLIPLDSETHGGEDVGIYARGPMAHLFHGTHEQSYIAHVAMRSVCVGPYKNACQRGTSSSSPITKSFRMLNLLPIIALVLKCFY